MSITTKFRVVRPRCSSASILFYNWLISTSFSLKIFQMNSILSRWYTSPFVQCSDVPINLYLTCKREVKRAKYWPSTFRSILWTETKSKQIKTQKKRTCPIFSHDLKTTDLLSGLRELFVVGLKRENLSRKHRVTLPVHDQLRWRLRGKTILIYPGFRMLTPHEW